MCIEDKKMEVQYEDYIKENFNFSNLFMLLCYYRMDFGVRNKRSLG